MKHTSCLWYKLHSPTRLGKIAVNCIFDTGSQRSYLPTNITYFLKPSEGQIKEVRLPLNTYTSRSTKNFQLVELKIGFGDGKKTTHPILGNKEFNIPYQFPYLRCIGKNLKQCNSKFAFTFSRYINKIKISGLIGVDLIECINRVNRESSNLHVALKVLDRTMTSLRKNKLDEAYNEIFFQQEKDGIIERFMIQPEDFGKFIGLMSRVFPNGLGDRGSIPGWVIPKTQKMILDAALLSTLQVSVKDKVEQSREWSSTLPYTSVLVAIEKGAFRSPSTKVANFIYIFGFLIGQSSKILNRWQLKSDLYSIVLWKHMITIP